MRRGSATEGQEQTPGTVIVERFSSADIDRDVVLGKAICDGVSASTGLAMELVGQALVPWVGRDPNSERNQRETAAGLAQGV